MNVLQKSIYVLSTIVLWSFDSRHPFPGVDGATWGYTDVKCHEKDDELCIGQAFFTTPSPYEDWNDWECEYDVCYPQIKYVGGWSQEFRFVEGLREKMPWECPWEYDEIINATNGIDVKVDIDDEMNCEIFIMGQRCDMCKAACFNGCKNDEGNRGS
jgi:hypothetical protein